MRRLLLLLLLLVPSIASAQQGFVTVQATVRDPVGSLYVNSQVNAIFFDPGTSGKLPLLYGSTFQQSYSGYGTNSFAFFSMSVADNQQIGTSSGATGTQWKWTIIYQDRATSFTYQTAIDCIDNIPVACVNGVMDISAPLQAAAALLPVSGGGTGGAFVPVTVPFSSTPIFRGTGNTTFNFTLTGNVTSSSFLTNPPPGTSPVYQFNICQDATGGRIMTWPGNVTLPPGYAFASAPNACSPVAFIYNVLTNSWSGWQTVAVPGGGGTGFANITPGTNTSGTLTIGTGGVLNANGTGQIIATAVPWNGITSFPSGCAANNFVIGVAQPNLACLQPSFVNISGTISTAQIPAGSTCAAGQVQNGINAALVANCIPLSNQTWYNNGSALPLEPFVNAVPPLLASDNPANTRIDIFCPAAIGVGPSHSAGCVPDPTASGLTTDYLARDMTYRPNVSAGTILPVVGTGIQFANPTCFGNIACLDTNDGLSWGNAKLTIYTALCSLPGGNCGTHTMGAGTVFVAPSTTANPTSGAGIWLMGCYGSLSDDPNCSSPPVGWLKSTSGGIGTAIIGIANTTNGPNGHLPKADILAGSNVDNSHPSVWLSGFNQGIIFENLYANAVGGLPGRGVIIGECANGNRAVCTSSTGVFRNTSFAVNTSSGAAGPCTDITGFSFWWWFEHAGCNGNAYNATGGRRADNAAAWLIDGSYLISIENSNSAAGGIKIKSGPFGNGLYVKDFTQEGDFSHNLPPSVWFAYSGSWPVQTDVTLVNVYSADPGGGSDSAIENDAVWGTGGPTIIGGLGLGSGAGYIFNSQTNQSGISTNPMRQGLTGVLNKYLIGQSNLAKRIVGLNPVVYTNLLSTNFSSWSAAPGGASITSVVAATDPFGGNKAGAVTVSGNTNVNFTSAYVPFTGNVGDWVVGGVFTKNWKEQQSGFNLGPCPTNGGGTFSQSMVMTGLMSGPSPQWDFVWAAGKVSSVSGGNICMLALVSTGETPLFYAPVQYLIPASAASDDEVLEFASSMGSIDTTCTIIGSLCNVSGHPVNSDSYILRSSGFTSTYTGGVLTANRTVTPADASGTNVVLLGPITGNKCTHTVGTTGAIQETANDCGSGGGGSGTVNPAPQWAIGTYVNSGSATVIGGISAPIGPNNVVQVLTSTPLSNTAQQGQFSLLGVPVRTDSIGNPITAVDRNSLVLETPGGALNVPISSTLYTNGFAFKMGVRSLNSVVSITPSSGTCNGASSCTMTQGENGTFTLDASGSNLIADIHPPHLIQGSGILFTPTDYGLSISAPGAVGTTGSPVAGNLAVFSAPATITSGNLSGDCTTAGTTVITCQKVNGVSYQAGGALGLNLVAVTTGVAATTYELVPAAAMVGGGSTTENGQSCVVGASCNINVGSPTHSMSLNQGNGNAITGLTLAALQIPAGVASADPIAYNLSELSATLYAAELTPGTLNAITACPSPAASALHAGQIVEVKAFLATTIGNPTLNWCSIGAKVITAFGTTLNNNDIVPTVNALLMYDGTTNFQLLNPQTNKAASPPTWDNINNAANNKIFSNAAFTSEFDQTTNTLWSFKNKTAAIVSLSQASPVLNLCGRAFHGSADVEDCLTLGETPGNGNDAPIAFSLAHTGTSTGVVTLTVPSIAFASGGFLTVPTSSGFTASATKTIGYDNATAANMHIFADNADAIALAILSVPVNNDLPFLNVTSGNVIVGDSGIVRTNVVQNTTGNATAANQVIVSAGANKNVQAIDFPERFYVPSANCNNATAGAGWSIGSGGTVTCRAGTNNLGGYIAITDTSTTFAQFTITIPGDWDTTTNPYIRFYVGYPGTDTGHTIIPAIKVSCSKGDGTTTDDVTFNASHSSSTITTNATANQFWSNSSVQMNSTDVTGCVAGAQMTIQIGRATDTATSATNFYGADVTFPRLITVGAQ